MTLESIYREIGCKHSGWRATKSGQPQCLDCGGIQRYVVPDTSLQAIADAWNNTIGHRTRYLRLSIRAFWPELAVAIVNALTKENK